MFNNEYDMLLHLDNSLKTVVTTQKMISHKKMLIFIVLVFNAVWLVIGFVDWPIDIICCECGRCCLSLRCDKKTLVTV